MAAKKTAKQDQIPGTEPESIADLDAASEAYNDAKLARVEASASETSTRNALIAAMRQHKRKTYVNHSAAPPITVQLVEGEDKITTVQKGDAEKKKRGKKGDA